MGDGIDGDGGRRRRSEAARKRTRDASRTCRTCYRRSVMAQHRVPDVGLVVVCRYCKAEHVVGRP